MLKVVSDTTPIISLLKLSKLEILKYLYSEIYIPRAVFREIEVGKHKNHYKNITKEKWVNIVEIQDQRSLSYFLDLDPGESESIVLATELNADLLLMDEKLGRYYAKHAGLNITGTVGVLMEAKKHGIVKLLYPILYELRKKDVWISDKLISQILDLVGESTHL